MHHVVFIPRTNCPYIVFFLPLDGKTFFRDFMEAFIGTTFFSDTSIVLFFEGGGEEEGRRFPIRKSFFICFRQHGTKLHTPTHPS